MHVTYSICVPSQGSHTIHATSCISPPRHLKPIEQVLYGEHRHTDTFRCIIVDEEGMLWDAIVGDAGGV